jgi:hypothetical protein
VEEENPIAETNLDQNDISLCELLGERKVLPAFFN